MDVTKRRKLARLIGAPPKLWPPPVTDDDYWLRPLVEYLKAHGKVYTWHTYIGHHYKTEIQLYLYKAPHDPFVGESYTSTTEAALLAATAAGIESIITL